MFWICLVPDLVNDLAREMDASAVDLSSAHNAFTYSLGLSEALSASCL